MASWIILYGDKPVNGGWWGRGGGEGEGDFSCVAQQIGLWVQEACAIRWDQPCVCVLEALGQDMRDAGTK